MKIERNISREASLFFFQLTMNTYVSNIQESVLQLCFPWPLPNKNLIL